MRVPVFCSLIPTDLIASCGFEPVFINADECLCERSDGSHCVFHENLCSYSKALYDFFVSRNQEFTIIIIPTACDALKKLYNALAASAFTEKIRLLDVPKIKAAEAETYLEKEFIKLSQKLNTIGATPKARNERKEAETPGIKKQIGIIGSNVPLETIEKRLSVFGFEPVFMNHCIHKAKEDSLLGSTLEKHGIGEYARLFLEKNSCPRTDGEGYRIRLLKMIEEGALKGLIVNTFKFCDFHPFDYKFFKDALGSDFPVMLIEHDLTADTKGQTMTRIDAFLENIRKITRLKRPAGKFYVGIDSGSHATKLVCVSKDRDVLARKILPTGTSVKKSASDLIATLCTDLGIDRKDIARIVATGYGRNEIEGADNAVTEITCHAIGAWQALGKKATLIDIGGQDSKAIKIGEYGHVDRFAMNDKCAAGTGRFLEVMSAKLEMGLSEFAALSLKAGSFVPISNMCSVFAESEVISLIASGKSKEEIARGIHRSIALRTVGLIKRIDGAPPYYMAGGGAKNRALIAELSKCMGAEVGVLIEPQFSGAHGAAILAAGK